MNEQSKHELMIERLSDYIDGALHGDECASLEAHLSECGACREALAELREVIAAAHLLGEVEPSRDLWPGVAAAISAPLRAANRTVIPLPTAREPAGRTPGIFLSPRQLAAAASILVIVSAAATWIVGPGLPGQAPGLAATPEASEVQFAADLPALPVGLAEELRSLEAALTDAGTRLDPETVRIIEKNLTVIERAIEDSRAALARDPQNEFLTEHLDRAYERKLDYLQSTVRVLEWAG